MRLFKRIGDIMSANLNDLVEQFEDPEVMLGQAIAEMETALTVSLESAAKAIATERLLARHSADYALQAEHWQQRAERAVQQGDDHAAKSALMQRRDQQRLLTSLTEQIELASHTSQKLKQQVAEMRLLLVEARQKRNTLVARRRAVEARRMIGLHDVSGHHDQAFGKFDRLSEKVERAEAEAEAMLELNSGMANVLDDLQADEDIDRELQQLKASCPRPMTETT